MNTSIGRRWRVGLQMRGVALAAAMLACASLPAQALPFYAYDGAVNSGPVNRFPIDVNTAVLDFLDNTLYVGNGALGSFSALAGAQLRAAAIVLGSGGSGDGSFSATGADTLVRLGGVGTPLMVGNWGTGSVSVSNGAVVDAMLDDPACSVPGAWCGSGVAGGAGATGLLRVEGAGSEVRVLHNLFTAGAWVEQGFGTPGGTATATVQIVDGGTLRSERGELSTGSGGPLANGAERSITHVTIDGAGSKWIVTPATPDDWIDSFDLSAHARAQTFMTLSNGGELRVDGSADGRSANMGVGLQGQATVDVLSGSRLSVLGAGNGGETRLVIGTDPGGVGAVTVAGAGSQLRVGGAGAGIYVGVNGAANATLTLADGAFASAGNLSIGGSGANGTVVIDAAGMELFGSRLRVVVGDAGEGSLTIRQGGVLDATLEPANCAPQLCGGVVGFRTGSNGTLTVTGAGSELRTLRGFTVGATYVDVWGGTPGGTATGMVQVLDGGTLRTEGANLGEVWGGSLADGTERSFATAIVDGPGSKWIVTRNTVDNAGTAVMAIGVRANGTATVTASNGGLLRIDGAGGAGPGSGVDIGIDGKGTLVVTGAGSTLETAGIGRFINVGASNASSDGSFELLAGGTASSQYFNVGNNGGKGELLIDGAGSQLTLSGVELNPASKGVAGAGIGHNGGIGVATVRNGGHWLISDGGQDGRAFSGSPGLLIGGGAGGQGLLTITGAGSMLEIVSTSLGLPAGSPDNFNAGMTVGRDSPDTASGTLMVSAGGKLVLTGHALSSPADSRSTSFNVGGRSDTVIGGSGVATVSGPGSEIRVEGVDGFVAVGRNGTGSLTLSDQATLSTLIINVGRAPSGVGTLVVDNSQIVLTGQQTGSTLSGAAMSIGNRGGNGSATVTNGSLISITNLGTAGAGLNLGGTSPNPLGTGTLTLSGGSQILINTAPGLATLSIGRDGSGSAALSGASLIDIGDGNAYVGRLSGGSGNLSITETSRLHGNIINIGGGSDTIAGGVGTATVSGLGSEIRADGANGFVGVGRSAVGTLSVANQGKVSAITMSVGRSDGGIGTLGVNNATLDFAGQQTTGNFAGASLYIGLGGGIGSASFANGSHVTMTNLGAAGASLNLGGTGAAGPFPLGIGTLSVSGGSQIKLVAAPGLAQVRIGRDGNGVASFSGASLLDAGDGNVIIAGEPGSTGILTLNGGSVVNAGYVGIGATPTGPGGSGHMILNNSTINTTTFEIGPQGLLSGDGGVINAAGDVIVAGTISPGNSPGRIIVNCNIVTLPGSKLILDVQANGSGFNVDHLILGSTADFNLSNLNVVFNFVGNTNPTAFALSGKFNLDTFLNSQNADTGLSTVFGGATWSQELAHATFTAQSSAYDISQLTLQPDSSTGAFSVTAAPVPEPATWMLGMAGLLAMAAWLRRQRLVQCAVPV